MPASSSIALGHPGVVAYMNRGRWVADCDNCGAGILLWYRDAGAMCIGPNGQGGCRNAHVQGQQVRILWPDEQTVTDVTEVLALRPNVENRNWSPLTPVPARYGPDGVHTLAVDPGVKAHPFIGERVVEELCVENLMHDCPIPDRLQAATEAWLRTDWTHRGILDEMLAFNTGAG